jgi:transcriptional regulator with XRE-family HTH domain
MNSYSRIRMECVEVALRLRRERVIRNIRRNDLAKEMGLTYTQMKALETGREIAKPEDLYIWSLLLHFDKIPEPLKEYDLVELKILNRVKRELGTLEKF